MTIRRLLSNEAQALRELRLRALRREPEAFCSSLERESAFPPEVWQERTRLAAESPEQAVFVASTGDRLVGMVGVAHVGEGHSDIWGVYLDEDQRRQGVGRALLEAALEWAGATRVTLEVNETLEAAISLYLARGFVPDGRVRVLEDGRCMGGWVLQP